MYLVLSFLSLLSTFLWTQRFYNWTFLLQLLSRASAFFSPWKRFFKTENPTNFSPLIFYQKSFIICYFHRLMFCKFDCRNKSSNAFQNVLKIWTLTSKIKEIYHYLSLCQGNLCPRWTLFVTHFFVDSSISVALAVVEWGCHAFGCCPFYLWSSPSTSFLCLLPLIQCNKLILMRISDWKIVRIPWYISLERFTFLWITKFMAAI